MSRQFRVLIAAVTCAAAGWCLDAGTASAAEMSHYVPGLVNLRDHFVPAPGFYFAESNYHYQSDDYRNNKGEKVTNFDLSFSRTGSISSGRGNLLGLEVTANGTVTARARGNLEYEFEIGAITPTFLYVTEKKILGGTYGIVAAIPLAYSRLEVEVEGNLTANLNGTLTVEGRHDRSISFQTGVSKTFSSSAEDSQWDLGDIYFRPFMLGWGGKHWSASTWYGVYAPTGDYDEGALDNTGLGYWTHEFHLSGAYYPWEHHGTALILGANYELHGDKDEADIEPGDHLTLDYGISQFLPLKKDKSMLLELGIAGYSQWQVDGDSGSDVANPDYEGVVHAVGLQVGMVMPHAGFALEFRWLHEYEAENHFQGDALSFTLAKKF